MTNFTRRLLILIPASRRTAFNTWINNNIDLTGGDWFYMPLSTTGSDPATHYWASAALRETQLGLIMRQLATMASITLPDWQNMTRPQREQWVVDNLVTIRTVLGIRIRMSDNNGREENRDSELAASGLLLVSTTLL